MFYTFKKEKMMFLKKSVVLAAAIILSISAFISFDAQAGYFDAHEAKKAEAHAVAENARALGATENDSVIIAAKALWQQAQSEIEKELDMLARVVYFEAGSSWISDRHQQLVACVLLNRCADSRFPDTISENIYRKGQYACAGRLYSVSEEKIPSRCYDNAKAAAYGNVECPSDVIFQAQFRQGRGVYERDGNTYFCYG
ncbi:MAG: cell wall hydrolase [Clostridia bacterium]|nr:cell wall hydrolase [Clostridia bacterium]